jgi:hypothetical protein
MTKVNEDKGTPEVKEVDGRVYPTKVRLPYPKASIDDFPYATKV